MGVFGKGVDRIGDGRGVVLLSWGVFREGFKTWFSPLLTNGSRLKGGGCHREDSGCSDEMHDFFCQRAWELDMILGERLVTQGSYPEAWISLGGSMEMFYAGKGGYPRG